MRKFKALKTEVGIDDLGYSGITFKVKALIENKIYTQKSGTNYIVDDNGCLRDIKDLLKKQLIKEI